MDNDRALRRAVILASLLTYFAEHGTKSRDWCVEEARRLEELLNPPDPVVPDLTQVIESVRRSFYDSTAGL